MGITKNKQKYLTKQIERGILFFALFLIIIAASESQAAKFMNASLTVKNKTKIVLTWTEKSVSGYEIYRAECDREYTPGEYKKIADVSGKKSRYVDKKVKYKKRYAYIIKGYKYKNGKKVYKFEANPDRSGLTAYTGMGVANWEEYLKSDTETTPNSIRLSGYQDGIVPTAYEIYRKEGSSSWKMIKTVKSKGADGGFEYIDTTVSKGKTYRYKFRSYKKTGGKKLYSKYSDVVKLTAVYRDPHYSLQVSTPSNSLNKSIVVGLTSRDGNGNTTLTKPMNLIEYTYRKTASGNIEYVDLIPVKYSYDNVNWQAFPQEGISFRENRTVYVELEAQDGKEFPFYKTEVHGSKITWWIQYNKMEYILDIDFVNGTASGRSNGEYYH